MSCSPSSVLLVLCMLAIKIHAFSLSSSPVFINTVGGGRCATLLNMANGAGGGKRKRRKRKQPIAESSVPPRPVEQQLAPETQAEKKIELIQRVESTENLLDDVEMKKLVKFDASEALSLGK